jgi:branched-chain amino acid transport system ATP-binding protein
MALLDVYDVTVRFGGVRALAGVSLHVNHGEIFGLVGPNGAGKTTLFNAVTGVIRPDSGRICYEENDIDHLSAHRRARLGIARTFQNLQLFGEMTVLENLMLPVDAFARRGPIADALRLPHAAFAERRAKERARAMLHLVGGDGLDDVVASDLPIGVQRRIELARALCLRPTLLLLDEPGSGLDARETAELAELLPQIRERLGTTMLLVDHDMALVMRVCDYLAVLDFGELIATGPPDRVRTDRRVIRAYLGEEVAS